MREKEHCRKGMEEHEIWPTQVRLLSFRPDCLARV